MVEHRVGVVVPTFRRNYILPNLIRAFQDQKHPDWIMWVSYVDDKDVESIAKMKEPRVRPVKSPKKGSGSQRNFGLKTALSDRKVKSICFFDDDDIPFTDYLSVLVEALEDHPRARAISCCVVDPHRGRIWKQNRSDNGSPRFPLIQGTTPGFIYRRDSAKPEWDSKGWYQNSRYSQRVLGAGHSHRGDIHLERALVILMRDLQGGLHHSEGDF